MMADIEFLDLSEAERDWNEFRRKVIDGIKDDDILGNTKARLRDFSSYYKGMILQLRSTWLLIYINKKNRM